jgi:hypothetical protein
MPRSSHIALASTEGGGECLPAEYESTTLGVFVAARDFIWSLNG